MKQPLPVVLYFVLLSCCHDGARSFDYPILIQHDFRRWASFINSSTVSALGDIAVYRYYLPPYPSARRRSTAGRDIVDEKNIWYVVAGNNVEAYSTPSSLSLV